MAQDNINSENNIKSKIGINHINKTGRFSAKNFVSKLINWILSKLGLATVRENEELKQEAGKLKSDPKNYDNEPSKLENVPNELEKPDYIKKLEDKIRKLELEKAKLEKERDALNSHGETKSQENARLRSQRDLCMAFLKKLYIERPELFKKDHTTKEVREKMNLERAKRILAIETEDFSEAMVKDAHKTLLFIVHSDKVNLKNEFEKQAVLGQLVARASPQTMNSLQNDVAKAGKQNSVEGMLDEFVKMRVTDCQEAKDFLLDYLEQRQDMRQNGQDDRQR